jgi:hypothetical protein
MNANCAMAFRSVAEAVQLSPDRICRALKSSLRGAVADSSAGAVRRVRKGKLVPLEWALSNRSYREGHNGPAATGSKAIAPCSSCVKQVPRFVPHLNG